MFFRLHNNAPYTTQLVTVGKDDATYGTLAVDLGQGRGVWREVTIDDLGGRRLRNSYATRYVPLQTATRQVTTGGVTSTLYAVGATFQRAVNITWLMPESVSDLVWSAFVNNSLAFKGTIDVRGLVALKSLDLSGGRALSVGVPDSIQDLYLSSRYTNPTTFLPTDNWTKHFQTAYQLGNGLKGQGYSAGTLGVITLGRHFAAGNGVFDLRGKVRLRRFWGTECGFRQVLVDPSAPLEEFVVAFNSLGRYLAADPETGNVESWWNGGYQDPFGVPGYSSLLPVANLKLLALGSSAVNTSNIAGQVLAPGGLPMHNLYLGSATQLQYLYLGGARMVDGVQLPDGDAMLELVAPLNDFTFLSRNRGTNPTAFSANLRYLAVGEAFGFNTPAFGQTGTGLDVCDLTGCAALKICIWSGAKTTTLILPATEGLLDLRLHGNSLTQIYISGVTTRPGLWPTTLQYLYLGNGQSAPPPYDNRLIGQSSSNTSYGQTTRTTKIGLNLLGCNNLIVVDGRQSNLNHLYPQANKASMVKLILSPIGTFRYTAGYLTITQANNNDFSGAGALNLSGYNSLTHIIANYCNLNNASFTLPGEPNGVPTAWAKNAANPLIQLEAAGNDGLTVCPFGAGDYPNLSSLMLGGKPNVSSWTSRGANRMPSIPRAHLSKLTVLGLEYQYQTGLFDFSAHPQLVLLNVERNGFGMAPGTAHPALPPVLTELYAGFQSPPAGTHTNRLNFFGHTAAQVDVIDCPSGRFDYAYLPDKPVAVRLDLSTNLLTDANLVIPANFSMPAGSLFRIQDNTGLTNAFYTNTLLPLIGTRLLCQVWGLGHTGLSGGTATALVNQLFAVRAVLAPQVNKILLLKASTVPGVNQAPPDYSPTMTEAAMTAAAVAWTAQQKLWVLRNGRSATVASYNWSSITTT